MRIVMSERIDYNRSSNNNIIYLFNVRSIGSSIINKYINCNFERKWMNNMWILFKWPGLWN